MNAIEKLFEQIRELFTPLLEQVRAVVDVANWDGAASNYADTNAYCDACLIDVNTDPANKTQVMCKLPVRKPSGTAYVLQAIHAAAAALAGGRGGLVKPDGVDATTWDAAIKKAANELIIAYNQAQEVAPDSIYAAAGKTPPANRASQIVMRQTDGKYRWFGIAATAVINHDNMIDSRALFDSFIEHIRTTGEYPKYDVLHFGEHATVGVADYVMRDGAVYVASGTFYDDEFSQAVARGLEADPIYWGHSIAFLSGEPQALQIYDVAIPVFTNGINQFISVVPRSRAASMFTDVAVQRRSKTMMTEPQFAELVKLVGADLAKQKRAELDLLNRTINEAGLIQRDQQLNQPAENPNPAAQTPATPVAVETRADVSSPAQVIEQAAPPAVTPPDATKSLQDAMTALMAKMDELMSAMGQMQTQQTQLAARVTQVEKPVEARIADALADAPEPQTAILTRAREIRANGGGLNNDPADMLEKLHAQRANRK